MATSKPRILLYGNCQGEWLSKTLNQWNAITDQYEVIYLVNHGQEVAHENLQKPELLSTFSLVLWQTAAGCKPPNFISTLPNYCRQIRFPSLFCQWLWPTATYDPIRHQPEPGFPQGRFCYGDRLLVKLLAEGVTPDDLPQRYIDTDVNTIMPMDRYHEKSLETLRTNDAESDIAVTPLIEGSFRSEPIFSANTHPNPVILQHVALALARAILDQPNLPPPSPPVDTTDILGNQEIPLHPQVVEHFRLTWVKPNKKWRYGAEMFTLEDYVRAYALNIAIPHQECAQMWMVRAKRAIERRELAEAERLLLKGYVLYPAFFVFLNVLGGLLLQLGNLTKAEKVLRYAIEQHPHESGLQASLALVMLRRNFPDEANRLYHTALQLDPSGKSISPELHESIRLLSLKTG